MFHCQVIRRQNEEESINFHSNLNKIIWKRHFQRNNIEEVNNRHRLSVGQRREETGRLNEKEVTCLEKQSGAGQAVVETTIIAIGLQV